MSSGNIYSIGHSNHSVEGFIGLLKQHRIDIVADVRSVPFSKYSPQFNRGNIKAPLNEASIKYTYFGKELGGRSDDPAHYVDGQVQYDRLAEQDGFKQAISRLLAGADDHRIALMCAEKDPTSCHRFHLVAEALAKAAQRAGQVCDVQHILAVDGDDGDGGVTGVLGAHGEMMANLQRSAADAAGQEDFFQEDLTKFKETAYHRKIAHRKEGGH